MLNKALVALDLALTGRVPAPTSEIARIHFLEDLFDVPSNGIIHLGDSGYSRLFVDWDDLPWTIFLCQGAREEVQEAWKQSAAEILEVNTALKFLCQEAERADHMEVPSYKLMG